MRDSYREVWLPRRLTAEKVGHRWRLVQRERALVGEGKTGRGADRSRVEPIEVGPE